MAKSASDAGNSEYEIRKAMIEKGNALCYNPLEGSCQDAAPAGDQSHRTESEGLS